MFRWVYDCGSNQSGPLMREIRRIGGEIDLLFLSHLDTDHVNGIDTLLLNRPTTEVVLPYLNGEERIVLMASAASEGAASGALFSFAQDPAAWLLARGVRRVTYIRGGDDGEGADPERPEKPLPDAPSFSGKREGFQSGWTVQPSSTGRSNVQDVPAGASVYITSASTRGIWTLLPQAHRPGPRLLKAFRTELSRCFANLSPRHVAQFARSIAGRDALAACYEKIWADHNLISMSLYAGPHHTDLDGWETDIRVRPHRRIFRGIRSHSGWISTGDAKLSVKARRTKFQSFFEPYLSTTAVLVAPHHGAATSWDDEVLDGFDGLAVGCAAAGTNSYGHPNKKVIDAIESCGAQFAIVGEDNRSDLVLEVSR